MVGVGAGPTDRQTSGPKCSGSESEVGGRRDGRLAAQADGVDDLAGMDALQIRRRGPEVGMAELALNGVEATPSRASSTA